MKVAFIDEVHEILKIRLESNGFECVDLVSTPKSGIFEVIKDFEGLVIRSRFPMDKSFLSLATNLKFIARSGAGMENIDIDFCSENSIQL